MNEQGREPQQTESVQVREATEQRADIFCERKNFLMQNMETRLTRRSRYSPVVRFYTINYLKLRLMLYVKGIL